VRVLERYLQDHHAGGSAGCRLAWSLAQAVPTSRMGAIADVAREIEEDLKALEQIMAELGVRPRRLRDAAARLGRLGARARRVVARDRENRAAALLIELELLEMGITGKRLLWITLQGIRDSDEARLEKLLSRATSQQATVEAARLHVAEMALRAVSDPAAGVGTLDRYREEGDGQQGPGRDDSHG
jgi:UDP-glucose 4-epimerase